MKTRPFRRSAVANQRGFNLIEVLASIAIVAIVAGGLTATTITTIKANAVSRDTMEAVSLAQDQIEQFRAMTFPAQIGQLKSGNDTVAGASGKATFARKWVVSSGPTAGTSQVTVTVSWGAPQPRSVSSVGYICRTATC
jgi:prepilin-type N-terminal cleavage/methylation domain-containing protein